jgi:hypothetical protein
MRKPPSDRFVLSWHERTVRSGPGRKQLLVGSESFIPSDLDRLMGQAQLLAADGYLITITPPTSPAEAS